MKWLIPCALMAVLGVTLAHSLFWGLLLFPLYVVSWIRYHPSKKAILILASTCLFFFLLTEIKRSHHITFLTGDEKVLPLRIVEPLKVKNNTAAATALTGKGEKIQIKLYLDKETASSQAALMTSSWCDWKGTLEKPSKARNPHLFNYNTYLWNQNIHWIFTINHMNDFNSCYPLTLTWKEKLNKIRSKGIDHLHETFPDRLVPLAKSLIFGDRGDMEEELLEAYQKLGVIHLLAISGMHVGMIVGMLWWSLLRLGFTKEKVRIYLLLCLPLYAVAAGGSPPVIRAVSMVMAMIIFTSIAKRITLLQALCFTLLIQLLLNPMVILQPGFQLSYAVSFSILVSAPKLLRATSRIISILKVTAISQLGAFPVLIWHFHEVSSASFLANLFYIPLFTLFLLPSLLLLYLLSFVAPGFTYQAATWLEKVVELLDELTHYLSAFPYATAVLGKPSTWLVLFYLLSLIWFFIRLEKGFSLKAGALFLMILTGDWLSSRFNPWGAILFIDVGQGDSILIDLPWGRGTYLIDTGGGMSFDENIKPFSVGREIIWPVLKARGITSIDKLILTHGDWDHIGGTLDLSSYIHIDEVWISPNSHEKDSVLPIVEELFKKDIPVMEKRAPYSWNVDTHSFTLMYPMDEVYEGNDDSLVLWGDIGGFTWLFTGDLEKEGEIELMEHFGVHADVLKVGHHGSLTSTSEEFLKQVDPDYAVISAGVNNRFNHPHPEVTERLKKQGATVLGTHTNGAIEYRFYRNKGTFRTMFPYDEE
ncbi:DNA internalization-related competence protein ComEC/Rec2 [Jeotgalibacillus sp. S-D1]|uniref:DNA internalization-related competence protein ComEC/Rec2 n=1 Tax=Jeotgalibacillus sp. S-D1 TaxID=2552189 RepID=UPI001059B0D4|nr:DNA internalization-related competence protein ComEC/Rec2 [Jeotgalibacillus sp. S-D1]TDL34482.1 DNA internalization-related competence protein ComEC/Rec2 [Jeotgalibacillus sp. S-D1]